MRKIRGQVNRMVSSTAANMASSRSHTVFTLEVEQVSDEGECYGQEGRYVPITFL